MDDIGFGREYARAGDLVERFVAVRTATEALSAGLTDEDQCVQSMPDASPAKWHRAHTTWFFEQFVLVPHVPDYRVFDPAFGFLFNSYYEAVGPRHPRPFRGLLTRPAASQVTQYRRHVDAALAAALPGLAPEVAAIVELGLHHEQQHQELLVTDMLHAFAAHPLCPAIAPDWQEPVGAARETRFIEFPEGLHSVGLRGDGFLFDNEKPRHRSTWRPLPLRRGLCAIGTGWLSSRTTATRRRRYGCRTAGRRCERPGGRHRCTGGMLMGRGSRPGRADLRRWIRMHRFATSVGMRRMRSLAGLMPGCRPSSSGRQQAVTRRCWKRPAMSGNGPRAHTGPILGIARRQARSASTTESS